MIRSLSSMIAVSLLMAAPATAGVTFLDFEDEGIANEAVGDFYAGLGVKFDGVLFNSIEYGNFEFEDSLVRDLRGMWGSDVDAEVIASGWGISSVTIGFESTGAGFQDLSFNVARMMDQDITIVARDAVTGEVFSQTILGASDDSDPNVGRTVEEFAVDLDSLLLGFNENAVGLWSEIAVHNHGGMFGIDDMSFLASNSVPGAAPALALVAGVVGIRRRRR